MRRKFLAEDLNTWVQIWCLNGTYGTDIYFACHYYSYLEMYVAVGVHAETFSVFIK